MIKNLLMLRLRAVFSAMTGKNKNGEYKKPSLLNIVLFVFLYLCLAAVFLFLSVMICTSVGALFIPEGEGAIYFAMISGISFSVIFVLSIFETKSELFDCKDNELLLSMPIPSGKIVIARIFVVLVYNYITEAIVAIPAAVIYLLLSGGEMLGFFGSLLTALVTPLAATALASAVGYLVALISKRVKNKTFITMFFSLAFIALYFVGYSKLFGMSDDADIDVGAIVGKLEVIKPLGEASMMSPLHLAVYLAVCLALAIGAYTVISRNYMSIVTGSHAAKRTEYKAKSMKNSSVLAALVKKELSLFMGSATYMLNAGIGVIFELAIAVLAIVKRNSVNEIISSLLPELGISDGGALLGVSVTAMLLLLSSTVVISAPSVSLEGKHLWIIKTTPVSARTVLLSKAITHLVVAVPPALVGTIAVALAFSIPPLYAVLMLISAIAINVFTALLGVVINVAFPKFTYDNDAQPIKQSLSVFLVMIIMMLLGVIFSILGTVTVILGIGWLFMLITPIAFATLSAVLAIIMLYPCANRFDSFSVS